MFLVIHAFTTAQDIPSGVIRNEVYQVDSIIINVNESSNKIGKGEYVLAEYGKIKRITIPVDSKHLLYLTLSKKSDHNKIIAKATKLKLKK